MRSTGICPFATIGALAIVALALASCGSDGADPSLVEHGQVTSDGGVELTLESVRYGGTGTIALLAPGGETGVDVSIAEGAISVNGFEDALPVVLHETTKGITVRLPPVDIAAPHHSLVVESVTLHTDAGESREQGNWSFDLQLPPEEDRADALRTEQLVLRAGEFPHEVSIVRSASETLVTYEVPAGVSPLVPPVLTEDGGDGASYLGRPLPRWTGGEDVQTFRASFPPTSFGSNLEVRMGLFGAADARRQIGTVELGEHLGAAPSGGDTYDIELPHDADDDRLELARVAGYEGEASGGGLLPGSAPTNLDLEVDVALEGVRPWTRPADRLTPAGYVLISDARGRVMPVETMRVTPGAGAGTTILRTRATDDHDLASVAVTVATASEETYPLLPALLVPAGE